jgi:hypothetical protein
MLESNVGHKSRNLNLALRSALLVLVLEISDPEIHGTFGVAKMMAQGNFKL